MRWVQKVMISVRTHSSKNTLFQHFIFTVYGANELELMHLKAIIDTVSFYRPSKALEVIQALCRESLGSVGKNKGVCKLWECSV